MEFKIYRASWVRGGLKKSRIFGQTRLLNDKNRMCCLGQIIYQFGIPLNYLKGVDFPSQIQDSKQMKDSGLVAGTRCEIDSWTTFRCTDLNDSSLLTDKEREAGIKKEMEVIGHTVKFVNGKAPWFNETNETSI